MSSVLVRSALRQQRTVLRCASRLTSTCATSSSPLVQHEFSTATPSTAPNNLHRYPGPLTAHQYSAHMPGSIGTSSKVVVDYTKGSWVYGKDGRKYLDFACGIGVTNLGHAHPKITAAIQEQAAKGIHWQGNCLNSPPMIQLAQNIGRLLPKGFPADYQVLFSNSGAESVENSIKLARHVTGRPLIIVFQGGFHGRTIGAGSLTTAKYVYRAGFQPTMGGVHVVPYAYCHRCPVSQANPQYCQENCCGYPITELKKMIKQQCSSDEVAAVLVEPCLGEGGYVVPPKSFMQGIREFCNETGALMIADEVQTGYGRTGTYFAMEQTGIQPDILVVAKGIANGLPLSAIVTSQAIMSRAKPGSIGGTYHGNVVACAAANAVVDVLTDPTEDILGNVNARGEQFRAGLKELAKKYPIADVRGVGLWNAVEFKDEAGAGVAGAIVKAGEAEGILLLNCGIHETLRFIPPLTISEDEMKTALQLLDKTMAKVFNKQ